MIKIKSSTDLIAWQQSYQLALLIYQITKKFPKEELYCLSTQIRRAAISTSSNIAEGFSRGTYRDKNRFYFIALGSLTETQNQLLLARDLGYLPKNQFDNLANKTISINKLINGLIKSPKGLNT